MKIVVRCFWMLVLFIAVGGYADDSELKYHVEITQQISGPGTVAIPEKQWSYVLVLPVGLPSGDDRRVKARVEKIHWTPPTDETVWKNWMKTVSNATYEVVSSVSGSEISVTDDGSISRRIRRAWLRGKPAEADLLTFARAFGADAMEAVMVRLCLPVLEPPFNADSEWQFERTISKRIIGKVSRSERYAATNTRQEECVGGIPLEMRATWQTDRPLSIDTDTLKIESAEIGASEETGRLCWDSHRKIPLTGVFAAEQLLELQQTGMSNNTCRMSQHLAYEIIEP